MRNSRRPLRDRSGSYPDKNLKRRVAENAEHGRSFLDPNRETETAAKARCHHSHLAATLKMKPSPSPFVARSASPIRVGFVMHKMQVAGAEVLVEQIIDRLTGQIEPTVFCLDDVGEIGYRLRDRGIPVIVLGRKPGLDLDVAKKLSDEIKQCGVAVLHAHQYTPFFYSALARLRHGAEAKILFTEHGRHYPDVVSWKRRSANRWLLSRYADVATACCDFSTHALKTIEGFPKAFTLNNGVDISELAPRGDAAEQSQLRDKLGLDQDRPYAACVARFHPVKDHATLVRAWAKVHDALPEAKLLLVGDGEERQNIEDQIGGLEETRNKKRETSDRNHDSPSAMYRSSLAKSISFLGIRDDVGDILRAVNVFTLTSVSEAASLTLLEAMASECPSVVTDVGGNGEHLRQGVDGYLVPRGDDQALADRLTELLSNRDKATTFGRSARQRVQQHFNLADAVDRYARLFRRLAEGV